MRDQHVVVAGHERAQHFVQGSLFAHMCHVSPPARDTKFGCQTWKGAEVMPQAFRGWGLDVKKTSPIPSAAFVERFSRFSWEKIAPLFVSRRGEGVTPEGQDGPNFNCIIRVDQNQVLGVQNRHDVLPLALKDGDAREAGLVDGQNRLERQPQALVEHETLLQGCHDILDPAQIPTDDSA